MKREKAHYSAKLSGTEKIESYLKNLSSNSMFSFAKKKEKSKKSFEIYGPEKTAETESLDSIQKQLSKRAKELKVESPDLVRNTGHDIFNAQKAEEIVLDGTMEMEVIPGELADSVVVTLTLVQDGDPKVDECIDQYAFLRVTWLANTLGMILTEFEKKTAPLH